jgi:hypothetical protein
MRQSGFTEERVIAIERERLPLKDSDPHLQRVRHVALCDREDAASKNPYPNSSVC